MKEKKQKKDMTILNIWEKNFIVAMRAEGRRVKAQRGRQSKLDMKGRVKEKSLTTRDGREQEDKRAASPKLLLHRIMLGEGNRSPAPG